MTKLHPMFNSKICVTFFLMINRNRFQLVAMGKKAFEITVTFSQFHQTAGLTSHFQYQTIETSEITNNRAKKLNQKDLHKNSESLATCQQNLQKKTKFFDKHSNSFQLHADKSSTDYNKEMKPFLWRTKLHLL